MQLYHPHFSLKLFCLSLIFFISACSSKQSSYYDENHISVANKLDTNDLNKLGLEYNDSIVNYLTEDDNIVLKTELLQRQMMDYWSTGTYDKAANTFELLCNINKGFINEAANTPAMVNYGYTLLYTGRYADAYYMAFIMLAKASETHDKNLKVEALLLLANVDIRTSELKEAEKNLSEAYHEIKYMKEDVQSRTFLFRYYLGCSALEIAKQDYSEAYYFIKLTEETSVEPESMPFALTMNIAIIYDFMNNDSGAEIYYKKIMDSPITHYNKFVAINNYADFLLRRNRVHDAINILTDNIEAQKANGSNHALAQSYLLLSDAYMISGEDKLSAKAAQSAIMLINEIMTANNRQQHHQINSIHDNAILSAKIEQCKSDIYALIILLIIFQSIFVLAILYYLYHKFRMDRRMASAYTEYVKNRYQNLFSEIKVSELKDIINQKNRELVACKLKVSQFEQALESFNNKNDNYLDSNAENSIPSIIDKLKSLKQSKSNWETLKLYFEEVHPGFYTRLEQLHPELTRGEKRMSAFILMGLNTSEIADINNRSPRTVESVKYQLKKKLGLSPEDSLEKYLNSLRSFHQQD